MGIYVTIIILCYLIMLFAAIFGEPITNYLRKRRNLKWQRQWDLHREVLTKEDLEKMAKGMVSFAKQLEETRQETRDKERGK